MTPLAIIQARIGSSRLPGKMLLDLGGRPLVLWATSAAVEAFGKENVVAAIPASPENDELAAVLAPHVADVFCWDGPEDDVLGRFHACAHRYRWRPESVIVRVTPDDPFKDPKAMQKVAAGERLPVEVGGEAFTLDALDQAHARLPRNTPLREHITRALFKMPPPPAPEGCWTVDTLEDLERARERVGCYGTVTVG